ncbi:MAG TPA: HlyD family efflux transporter periplasmic adaptor subunit [Terriglobales bacterium]|nr:HlyD family efflux transporter periplasmic adaptor subunit [Terriglobales bacterium]
MKGKLIAIALIAAAAIAATALYAGWFHRDNSLRASGTVEARDIQVGSEVGGRIDKVLVQEGDTVQPGQEIVIFDDKELTASLDEARADAIKMERGYRKEDIAQARAAVAQAKADYELKKNGYRKEDVLAAQAAFDSATADETRTRLDFERYDSLAKKDLVSRQQRDTAEANWKMALAQKDSAAQKLKQMHQGYRPEEIAAADAQLRQAEATLDKYERGNRPEDIAAAKASLAYQEARFRERRVLAPAAATVEVLDVRPGDLIAPNAPVATLLERDELYVRVYIPETEIGRVRLGQKAEMRVDSFPNEVFHGTVEQINQQAEFLPRNVQTRDDRVHQVFGVKVRVDDPSHRIRAGMAADVKLPSGN